MKTLPLRTATKWLYGAGDTGFSLSSTAIVVYFAVLYVLYDTAASVLYMPYYALTPELTRDYDERTSLTSYRMLFSIVGSLLIFAGAQSITGSSVPENRDRFFLLGLVIAAVSVLSILITFFGTRERPRNMSESRPALLESLRAVKNNRPFLYGLGIYIATWVAVDMMQAVLLFFVKYVLGREPLSYLILGSIFVSAVVTLPLWGFLSRRWGKRRTYIFGILFWIVVQSVLVSLGQETPLWLILGLCVCAGVGVGAAHVLPWAMLPDSMEWDELHSGGRHEGMHYSIITLGKKIASAAAIPAVFFLFGFSGFEPNVAELPRSAVLAIRLLAGPIPAVLLVLGIIPAARYPLTREAYRGVLEKLDSVKRGESDG